MAKKKKASEKQAYFAQQRKEKRKADESAKRKKKRTKKTLKISISCAVVAAVLAGGITLYVKADPFAQWIPAEKTENYSLNAAEISFYAWQIYTSYVSSSDSNSSSASTPDTEKALSKQDYDDDTTWEAYFLDAAKDYAKNILSYCEAADAADFTPSDDISSLVDNAKENIDFDTMPSCIREENVDHALELYFRAQSFNTDIQNNLEVTEEDKEAYYEENAKTMQICSYMEFSFSYGSEAESATTEDEAKEYARDLRKCGTREEFEDWVRDYYAENTSLSEEDLDAQVETLYMEDAAYTEDDSVSEWAFSGNAKDGESTILTDTDNSTITVCLLIKAPERDETNPINLRQILFTASTYESADGAHTAAENALALWEDGDKTEDTFADLADQYTEDTSVSGGLYQNVTKSQLSTTWKEWCFDESRQVGDVTILDSSYGSCIVYYSGVVASKSWELTAISGVREQKYADLQESYQDSADVQTTNWVMHFAGVNNLD